MWHQMSWKATRLKWYSCVNDWSTILGLNRSYGLEWSPSENYTVLSCTITIIWFFTTVFKTNLHFCALTKDTLKHHVTLSFHDTQNHNEWESMVCITVGAFLGCFIQLSIISRVHSLVLEEFFSSEKNQNITDCSGHFNLINRSFILVILFSRVLSDRN